MLHETSEDSSFLALINESWLGVATPKKHKPAVAAFANHLNSLQQKRFECAGVLGETNRQHGIDYYGEIVTQIRKVSTVLKDMRPARLMNIGCDCGTEFAPITYLLSQYQEKLAVFWFDAHAHLNTPSSPTGGSHSGHFHGMVLRALTGHGSFGFPREIGHPLLPSQIILAGSRELDPDEHTYVAAEKIKLVLPQDIGKKAWLDVIESCVKAGMTHAYIHIDFDVLAPEEFPWVGCPTPGGISIEALRLAIMQIYERFEVPGISAVEISADGEDARKATNIAKNLLCNLHGEKQ